MNDRISALLGAAQESLREQLEAAEQTFQRLQRTLDARDSAQIATLNHAVRRLRGAASGDPWAEVIVSAAQSFADRAALFVLQGNSLRLEAVRGVEVAGLGDVPLSDAPAFRACVETKDSVIAMRTAGEMSPALASRFSETPEHRFYLFPVISRDRGLAVLYADVEHGSAQTDALELLTTVAGAVLEPPLDKPPLDKPVVEKSAAGKPANGLVSITSASSAAFEEQDLHLKAQRFARVQVAEIRLYKSENVKNGRAGQDLYTSLKTEIDSAREVFRHDFISRSPTMVDYLHGELVRTLANDDAALLGPDYPGPMQ